MTGGDVGADLRRFGHIDICFVTARIFCPSFLNAFFIVEPRRSFSRSAPGAGATAPEREYEREYCVEAGDTVGVGRYCLLNGDGQGT